MKENRDYFLLLHRKQGDELADRLEAALGDPSEAFTAWARDLKEMSDRCYRISQMTKGRINVEAYGDTNYIGFRALDDDGERLLDVMVAEKLIDVEVFDDTEYVDLGGESG